MITSGLMSSLTDEWETPQDLFDKYDEIYHFTLDAAASDQNHKCPKYYTKADDGLSKMWGGCVWCNPPYGKQIKRWIHKAYEHFIGGGYSGIADSCPYRHKMVS